MAEASLPGTAASLPPPGRTRNLVAERLRLAKRAAVEAQLGKSESWATKVVNGESGVLLDDLPLLLAALGLKVIDAGAVAVDPAIATAFETIVAKAVQGNSLLIGPAE